MVWRTRQASRQAGHPPLEGPRVRPHPAFPPKSRRREGDSHPPHPHHRKEGGEFPPTRPHTMGREARRDGRLPRPFGGGWGGRGARDHVHIHIHICSPPRSTSQWFSSPEKSDGDSKIKEDCCEIEKTKQKNNTYIYIYVHMTNKISDTIVQRPSRYALRFFFVFYVCVCVLFGVFVLFGFCMVFRLLQPLPTCYLHV